MSNIIQSAILDKVGIPRLKSYLNLTSLRHKLISDNVANVLTPGYKTKDIDFQSEFQRLKGSPVDIEGVTTNPRHIPLGLSRSHAPKIVTSRKSSGNGINNVNIDKEMTKLATNQISYTVAARMVKKKFASLNQAITGRK